MLVKLSGLESPIASRLGCASDTSESAAAESQVAAADIAVGIDPARQSDAKSTFINFRIILIASAENLPTRLIPMARRASMRT